MATTNLITTVSSDRLTQIGNGVPDHTALIYSQYIDLDNGNMYTNTDGSTTWSLN